MNPLFSIVLPAYNRGDRIGKAIQSVLDQTYSNWELIIVDDGSTDNTKEVCLQYQDPRISYVYQDNAERSAARNKGIALSQGVYIGFLDSDDVYAQSFLEEVDRVIQKLEDPNLVFTGLSTKKEGQLNHQPIPALDGWDYKDYLLIHSMATPRAVIHKECFSKALFPEDISIGEDRYLWVRLAYYYPIAFCPKAIVVQRDFGDRSIDGLEAKIENYISLCKTIKTREGTSLSPRAISVAKARGLLAIARWHMHNKSRVKSILYVLRSLWVAPFDQGKFKANLLLRLLLLFPLDSILTLF